MNLKDKMRRKVIQNELALLKIANYEYLIIDELLNETYFFEEIANTIKNIECGNLEYSFLIDNKKKYEKFVTLFKKSYKRYLTLLNATQCNLTILRDIKRKYFAEHRKLERLVKKVSIAKSFINKVIDKRNFFNNGLPNKIIKCRNYIRRIKDKLIEDNRYLAVSIAGRYGIKTNLEDIVDVGVQGLIKAINMFDVSRGNKFSTYAFYWTHVFIREAITADTGNIKIPLYLVKRMRHIAKVNDEFESLYNREPTIEELSDLSRIDIHHIEELQELSKIKVDSLSRPVGKNYRGNVGDLIADNRHEPNEHLEKVEQGLAVLNDIERSIIIDSFGLYTGKTLNIASMCAKHNINKKIYQEIKACALDKIKNELINFLH